MNANHLAEEFAQLVRELPSALHDASMRDIRRQVFHVSTVAALAQGGRVCDIGGGVGLFSLGCTVAGLEAVLVDDFADPINAELGDGVLDVYRSHGVKVLRRDVIEEGFGAEAESFDIITSFDNIEHLHHSPKALLHEVTNALRPGGWFFLGAPNCVDLKKRVTVLLGRGKWSGMADWYEQPRFRGHVREPDPDDLRYIARDMGLVDVRIEGRNWNGYSDRRRWVRRSVGYLDPLLQRRPSLCSDIYIVGRRE